MNTIRTNSRFNPAAIASRPSPGSRLAPPPNLGSEPPPCQAEIRPPCQTAIAEPPPQPSTLNPQPGTGSKSGLKKLNFGSMTAKKEEGSKKSYPVFTDADGRAAALAATIIEQQAAFDALDGSMKTNKAELKFMVAPEYFQTNSGKHEVPSSMAVKSSQGEVLVTFQNRYKTLPDESGLVPILGGRTEKYFRQAFELKVDGDQIPADSAQELLDQVQALFARYHCAGALEVKSCVKPTTEFHAARHLDLTWQENLQVEEVCPITATVKTKGRGK
jgi:hypothetical protein